MNPQPSSSLFRFVSRPALVAVLASAMIAGTGLTACNNDDNAVPGGSAATVPGSQASTQSSDPTQATNGAVVVATTPDGQPADGGTAPAPGDGATGEGADSNGSDGAGAPTTPNTAGTPAPNNYVFDLTKDGFGLTVTEVGTDTHFVVRNGQGETVYDKTFANSDPALSNIIVFPEGAEGDPNQGEVVFADDAGNEIVRFPLVDVLNAKENSNANG